MKIGTPVRIARGVRARAISSLICIVVMASLTVGAREAVLASDASPLPNSHQLFGVHPVEQGRTTLPGGHFNFALVPGQSVADGIVVENLSDHALSFHVYGADLVTATGGGLAPAQPTALMRQVGAWIAVSVPTFNVPAHRQFIDAFRLTLPTVVTPGQHLGALVASASVGVTPQGNPIEARVALIAVVTVPGTVMASARLSPLVGSGALPGRVDFGITLSNTGNVLLTYRGSLRIADGDGDQTATVRLSPTDAYVVPNGNVPLAAAWSQGESDAEVYHAQATVTILANGIPVRTLTSQSLVLMPSSGMPFLMLAGAGLLLMAVLLFAAWAVHRDRRRRERTAARRLMGLPAGSSR